MNSAIERKLAFFAVIFGVTFCAVLLGLWFRDRSERRYDPQILVAANRYKLDPAVIKAVIWQESRFNARARGKAGEIGLMQVREDAAYEWAEAEKVQSFAHERIMDPETNILCGSFYLAKLLKRYADADDPLPYALADYNAGRSHVLKWNKGMARTNSAAFLEQMDFPGTRQYARNIMEQRSKYAKHFQNRELAIR